MLSIQDLPREVKRNIFRSLDFRSKANISQCSSEWLSLLGDRLSPVDKNLTLSITYSMTGSRDRDEYWLSFRPGNLKNDPSLWPVEHKSLIELMVFDQRISRMPTKELIEVIEDLMLIANPATVKLNSIAFNESWGRLLLPFFEKDGDEKSLVFDDVTIESPVWITLNKCCVKDVTLENCFIDFDVVELVCRLNPKNLLITNSNLCARSNGVIFGVVTNSKRLEYLRLDILNYHESDVALKIRTCFANAVNLLRTRNAKCTVTFEALQLGLASMRAFDTVMEPLVSHGVNVYVLDFKRTTRPKWNTKIFNSENLITLRNLNQCDVFLLI